MREIATSCRSRRKAFPLLAAGFFALLMVSAIYVCKVDPQSEETQFRAKKALKRELAHDGTMSRQGIYGIDLVSFKSVRVEKRKVGYLTLGAFNKLVIDELSVVVPEDHPSARAEMRPAGGEDVSVRKGTTLPKLLDGMGISEGILGFGGHLPRISGLVVNGLSIARLDAATNVVPRLMAKRGEMADERLELFDCRLIDGSVTQTLERAQLVASPSLQVAWNGKRVDL